jgi:glycosyltransferase involved in cell wall biosynthesis
VPEVVLEGENGLLVPTRDPESLAESNRRFFADDYLRRRLSDAAAASVAGYTEESVFARIEDALEAAVR